MEDGSSQRTRDKALYWKNLNPVFKVDLRGDFRSKLEIPLYFSENLRGRLPRKVALKGPGTDIDTWEVLVATTTYSTSLTGEGWRDFVTTFCLEENDTLVFKYKNNSYFKVRVISGKTSCEKESSHFVIFLIPPDYTKQCKKEMVGEKKNNEDYGLNERKDVASLLPHKRDDSIDDYEKKSAEVTESSESPYAESRKRKAEAFASPVRARVKTECMSSSYQSDRERYAGKIENARQRAKRMQMVTDNSFFVPLSRSHVSGGSVKLGITRQWWNTVIKCKEDQNIDLRCKGDNQGRSHKCFCVYDDSKNTATITSGWKKFVLENTLCENDCCVFQLAKPWKEGEVIHLEVEIIRAIE